MNNADLFDDYLSQGTGNITADYHNEGHKDGYVDRDDGEYHIDNHLDN